MKYRASNSNMTVDEAIEYCYRHRDEYIKDTESINNGIRQFDCLIACLESGTIKPEELADYGMDYKEEDEDKKV